MTTSRERILDMLNSLPEVDLERGGERNQHLGAAVRNKRCAWYLDDHHGDGTVAITCKAPADVNDEMADSEPERYFIPSYTGPRGWIGIRLDDNRRLGSGGTHHRRGLPDDGPRVALPPTPRKLTSGPSAVSRSSRRRVRPPGLRDPR